MYSRVILDKEGQILKILTSQIKYSSIALVFEITSLALIYTVLMEPLNYKNLLNKISFFYNIDYETAGILAKFFSIFYFTIGLLIRVKSQNLHYLNGMKIEVILGEKLYSNYLSRNFEWHKNNHTSNFFRNVLQDASQMVSGYYLPVINLYTNVLILISIILFGIYLNTLVTIAIILFMGIIYLLFQQILSKDMSQIGRGKIIAAKKRYKFMSETAGNIREIFFDNNKISYQKEFKKITTGYTDLQAKYLQLGSYPILLIENLVIVSIIIVGFIFNAYDFDNSEFANILFSLMLITRLLPVSNKIYSSLANLKFTSNLVKEISNKINESFYEDLKTEKVINFESHISLNNIIYKNNNKTIINKSSLKILKGEKVVINGISGSGKSTLLEMISGLIFPNQGAIFVDHTQLSIDNIVDWRKKIAFIPQKIYLFDNSVVENIINGNKYDHIKYSLIDEICSLSENGLNSLTECGEDGVRISGGQRQRIAIARALYRNNIEVLILDESTSALDKESEERILKNIWKYFNNLTVICINHNLYHSVKFDRKFSIQEGKIIE